jgi:pepF/M3 family oligoendopeptidase
MKIENTNLPHWDLSSIYSSSNGIDYKKALKTYENGINSLKNLINLPISDKNFSETLISILTIINKTKALYTSFSSYAYCAYSTDTTNIEYLNNMALIEKKGLLLKESQRSFQQFLTTNSRYLPLFYTSYPQHKNYEFLFAQAIFNQEHMMSNNEEAIADEMQLYAQSSWSKLQEQIISNLVDTKSGKTFNELRTEAYSKDQNIRKNAYNTEISLLKNSEIPLAAALNNLKGAKIALNKRHHWESALDHSCFISRLHKKTLFALISAIEDSLPMWRDYMHIKAKLLGLKELNFYDLFAPLQEANSTTKKWTFNETREYIIDRYNSFSEDMGNFAKKAFDEHWIDAEIRPGKVGGAYDTPFPAQGVSRILSNFNGTFNDVTTLAHELGHAYHDYCVKDLPYSFAEYPMTLAETASIFAETIVMNDMISKTSGFEKIKLIEMHLQDCNQVLVDILARFYFETAVFKEREEGELSASDFCRLMEDAQEKTYGNGLSKIKHPYQWAIKSHYYIPDFDFYNYPYAFGQLFAAGLYAQYQKKGPSFASTYKSILKNTGSMSCESVCHNAGFDIETKEFWASGISVFAKEFDELKTYANTI